MDCNVFIETKAPRHGRGYYAYIIEVERPDGTRQLADIDTWYFLPSGVSKYRAELIALIKVLERFTRPCRINLYTNSAYIAGNMINGNLNRWQSNGYMTSRGAAVVNRDLWQKVYTMLDGYTIHFEVCKKHKYKARLLGKVNDLSNERSNDYEYRNREGI